MRRDVIPGAAIVFFLVIAVAGGIALSATANYYWLIAVLGGLLLATIAGAVTSPREPART